MKSESDDAFIFDETDKYEIDPLLSIVNVMILEKCRDEVDLLNSYRKSLIEKQPIMYSPIDERFGFSDEIIRKQNLQIRLGCTQNEFTMLGGILTLLKDVLEYGISDLLKNKSFQMLAQAVDVITEMNEDEIKLLSNFKSNYDLNSKLTEEVLMDKLEALDHLKEVENKINLTRGHFEEFLQEAGVKYNTVLDWERSRNEQNLYQQKMKESIQERAIREKKTLMKNEEIASNQMRKFYEEHMKDLKAEIANWMIKYDEDMDATDIAIMKERIKVEDMQNQLQDLVRILQTREKEMLDWIEVRNRRRDEAIKIAIQNWAAIKIQRWWRNILQAKREAAKKKKKANKKKKQKNK